MGGGVSTPLRPNWGARKGIWTHPRPQGLGWGGFRPPQRPEGGAGGGSLDVICPPPPRAKPGAP
eukprot:4916935-Pyramimonas_sp.AAC.2